MRFMRGNRRGLGRTSNRERNAYTKKMDVTPLLIKDRHHIHLSYISFLAWLYNRAYNWGGRGDMT